MSAHDNVVSAGGGTAVTEENKCDTKDSAKNDEDRGKVIEKQVPDEAKHPECANLVSTENTPIKSENKENKSDSESIDENTAALSIKQ